MAVENRTEARRAIKGGLVAGVAAGIVTSIVLLAMNVVQGNDVWQGMKFAGYPFLQERAFLPSFDALAVLVGVASHFLAACTWGVLFALVAFGLGTGGTVIAGMAWGFVVWAGMYLVVLPVIGLGEQARTAPLFMSILNHVFAYGLPLGLAFLPFQVGKPKAARAPVTAPAGQPLTAT